MPTSSRATNPNQREETVMDKVTALGIYHRAYNAHATTHISPRTAREMVEAIDFRNATREQLEQHAAMAAINANMGIRS
jgi:hypothetical protein